MERSEFLCLAIALLVAICSLLSILHQRPSRGEALRWGFASIVGFIVSFLCYFDVRTRLSEEPQRQYEESFRLETTARQLLTNGTVSIDAPIVELIREGSDYLRRAERRREEARVGIIKAENTAWLAGVLACGATTFLCGVALQWLSYRAGITAFRSS
jgi:hypothetical protein